MYKYAIFCAITVLTTQLLYFEPPEESIYRKNFAKFRRGFEHLKKLSENYVYREENFDWSLYHDYDNILENSEEFDFVVVGAGAAGAALANRLSENPQWRVLLLEAGGDYNEYTQIPGILHTFQNTDYNWHFKTTPQQNCCLGMVEERCSIAAGKILGGTTSINAMVYTRGNALDYDLWASSVGNQEWSYDDILAYFKKIENANLTGDYDYKYRNYGGPLNIETAQHPSPLRKIIYDAASELGLQTDIDYNGANQIGIARSQVITKNKRRQSVAEAYLKPAEGRRNFLIKTGSRVIKILFNKHNEAESLEYLNNGKLHVVRVKNEIILSAGVINTPKILMLSGIGPKNDLDLLGIPTIKNLTVGANNLKDHLGFFALDFIDHNSQNHKIADNNIIRIDDQIENFFKHNNGTLVTTQIDTVAFLNYNNNKSKLTQRPDFEFFFVDKNIPNSPNYYGNKYKNEIFDSLWSSHADKPCLTIGFTYNHPKSSGSIKLASKDPLHQPLIDLNQLSESEDLEMMLLGVKMAFEFVETRAIRDLNLTLNRNHLSLCRDFQFGSDDYWRCCIKALSFSLRHLTGSCRMGKDESSGVVDSRLRVFGVKNLRVADASVIPVTISGHIMGPAIMIGEKAADLIKEDWV